MHCTAQATVALPNLPCLIILHRKIIEDELPFRTETDGTRAGLEIGQRTDSLGEKSHPPYDGTFFAIDELQSRECQTFDTDAFPGKRSSPE